MECRDARFMVGSVIVVTSVRITAGDEGAAIEAVRAELSDWFDKEIAGVKFIAWEDAK